MHKVQRAIIMAAGLGNRMRPVTLTTPKPLVKVNGIRMIDTVIEGLHQNGIYEIYVVVGYLKDQFMGLEQEYPGVRLIENPYYDTCNNISSLYVAREHIENAIILDGDQIIYNAEVLSSEFERSGYNSIWTDEETDEWLQTVENGIVTSCSRYRTENYPAPHQYVLKPFPLHVHQCMVSTPTHFSLSAHSLDTLTHYLPTNSHKIRSA